MNANSFVARVVVLAGCSLAAGCSTKEAVPARAPTVEYVAATPIRAAETKSSLTVDDAIVKACGLPTPQFAFDSSRIQESADGGLDVVAKCFTSGPLVGRSMRLVGHTDPRGEVEYNYALGQRRAGSVASYLEQHGVKADRIAATSRGEIDAVGTDEAGWERDRRVEMHLVN